jgi:hypothetical protein
VKFAPLTQLGDIVVKTIVNFVFIVWYWDAYVPNDFYGDFWFFYCCKGRERQVKFLYLVNLKFCFTFAYNAVVENAKSGIFNNMPQNVCKNYLKTDGQI